MAKDTKSLFRIPKIKDDTMKVICGILNIFISGSGTIIGGVLDGTDIMVIVCGILQLICGGIGIGYIWSWVWAYFIFVQKQVC